MAFEWLTSAFSSAASKKPEEMSFDEARPAFFTAIKKEDLETLTAISKKFPDALGWENSDGSSLYIALEKKKLGAFKHLVELGADLRGESGGLMNNAAVSGKKDFILYMLEQGVVNVDMSEYYARSNRHFDIADMIKRKDIIRAEYLAQNPPTVPPAPAPAAAPSGSMETAVKIEVLSPVQLKKTPDSATL
jgi:hypothetical protein